MRISWGLTLILSLALPGSVFGSKSMQPGEPYFGLYLHAIEAPHLGEEFSLIVRAGSAQHGRNCLGDVHIDVPTSIEVTSGDVSRKVHVSNRWTGLQDGEWILRLRPIHEGQYTIHGLLRISCDGPKSWDETETAVDLDVRADTTLLHGGYSTRFEQGRGGQRFRYGRGRAVRVDSINATVIQPGHMVLIEGPEAFLAEEVDEHPQPLVIPRAACHDCGLAAPRVVERGVTVAKNGTVSWIESPSMARTQEDPRVTAAVEAALKRAQFRPARSKARPVDDWAVVEVMVEP